MAQGLEKSPESIAAVATGPAAGAVGIVRISGPAVSDLVLRVCRVPVVPRQAQVCRFFGADGNPVDHGIALFFPGPKSYTGEDVLELHGHGGGAVLQLVLQACLSCSTAERPIRLAQPGEFTKRAFINQKLDLLQAQAVADLIEASSQQAVRAAVSSLTGGFSRAVQSLQRSLTDLRMRVEACLDFPEEDIDVVSEQALDTRLGGLIEDLEAVRRASTRGLALKQGFKIALIGAPNVGKSSLLNALAEEEVAIVTPIAGTTRDRISQEINIDGLQIQVVDTAGIRITDDPVEQQGVARSWQAIDSADLVLFLIDPTAPASEPVLETAEALLVEVRRRLDLGDRADGQASGVLTRGRVLWQVFTKSDLISASPELSTEGVFWLSAKTGVGLDRLREALKVAAGLGSLADADVFSARTWQIETLQRVGACFFSAQAHLSMRELDLFAEQLRLAQNLLSELTGEMLPDDLLGVIFSQFCIGK
ncbi:MAG: hypothetical protein RLZZ344_295 [Pseudomonadota bacterium]|jgi:tRNA modification GTPase